MANLIKADPNDKMLGVESVSALDLTKDDDIRKINGVRLYRSSPGRVKLQIRSVGSTNQNRGGVKKHIVSSADLDAATAKQLMEMLRRFIDGEII